MPPRKAGPVSAPSSPPVMKISPPLKRKPSGFKMKNDAKKVKKVVRFDYDVDCDEPEISSSSNLMESIQDETQDPQD
jgi:hypothetical protein